MFNYVNGSYFRLSHNDPCSALQNVYPLTAPIMIPFTKYFWKNG